MWFSNKNLFRFIAHAIAPAAFSASILIYFNELHYFLYLGTATNRLWTLPLLIPPLVAELIFTLRFEAHRMRFRRSFIVGLVVRLIGIILIYYVLIWNTLALKGKYNTSISLIGKWPYVARFFWLPDPVLSVAIGIVLISLYLVITCRFRMFRFTTTMLLPLVGTFILFNVFYYHPSFQEKLRCDKRPAFVEKVFPFKHGDSMKRFGSRFAFSREIYVSPDDGFALFSFGSTFGRDTLDLPNVVYLDLRTKQILHIRMDTVRRFYSECPDAVYFAPWHYHNFYSFTEKTKTFSKFMLPSEIGGAPIEEINYVYHACDNGMVYFVNNRNPVFIAWDERSKKLKKAVSLVGRGGGMLGDSLGTISRNRLTGKLYLLAMGRHQVIEMDERKIEPSRFLRLPHDGFEVDVSPDGKYLYVPAFFKGVMWKLDANNLKVIMRIKTPIHCRRVAVSDDGRLVFAASYFDGYIQVYDADTGRKLLRFYVTPKLEGMYLNKKYLYCMGADGLFRISNDSILRTLSSRGNMAGL